MKNRKRYLAIFLTATACMIGGCSSNQSKATKEVEKTETETTEITDTTPDALNIPGNADDFIGIDALEAKKTFEKAGFKTIKMTSLEDLETSTDEEEGKVSKVLSGSSSDFVKNDSVSPATEIEIQYHSVKQAEFPLASADLEKMTPEEVQNALKEAGFSHFEVTEVEDLDPDEYDQEFITEVQTDSSSPVVSGMKLNVDTNFQIIKHTCYPKYSVYVDVVSESNLLFSKYDIGIFLDDEKMSEIENGEKISLPLSLRAGEYTLHFENLEDKEVFYDFNLNVSKDMGLTVTLKSHNDSLDLSVAYDSSEEEPEIAQEEPGPVTEAEPGSEEGVYRPSQQSKDSMSLEADFDINEFNPSGDRGQYAYIMHCYDYDVYYLIDFDEGYVYYFLGGPAGDDLCQRYKIEEGNLNSEAVIVYHEEGEPVSSNSLSFERKNDPDRMVLKDDLGLPTTFFKTNISDALNLLSTKRIKDY